jgi:hypothetical protein
MYFNYALFRLFKGNLKMRLNQYKDSYYFISDVVQVYVNYHMRRLKNNNFKKVKSGKHRARIIVNKKELENFYSYNYDECLEWYKKALIKYNIPEYKKIIIDRKGEYYTINFFNKELRVHRLVAELFIPNPNNYDTVNHLDGRKLNNHYTNLEWCTQSKNVRHSFKNKLQITKYTFTKFYIPDLQLTFNGCNELYNYFENLGYERSKINNKKGRIINKKLKTFLGLNLYILNGT